ncbi:MAG: hypothetical protein ACHBN1_03085 [Heteroscytonema crispum UTEX LB 1556]
MWDTTIIIRSRQYRLDKGMGGQGRRVWATGVGAMGVGDKEDKDDGCGRRVWDDGCGCGG